jgi:hypothetical protein
MVEGRDKRDRETEQPKWVPFAKFLLLVSMTVGFFLLAQDMVNHHFFTGGELNNRSAAVGP